MKPVSSKINKFICCASVVYGIVLLYLLFLKNIGADYPLTYTEYLCTMSNLVPLKGIYILLKTPAISASIVLHFLINLFGNIFLFIPYGFLIPLYFKSLRAFKKFIISTLIVVLLIETIQFFAMLGIFDIDDILLRTAGACIGFSLQKRIDVFDVLNTL